MTKIISVPEVRKFIISALTKSGGQLPQANDLGDILISADTRGHYSHGLNRLEMYCKDYIRGTTSIHALPTIEKETLATALVNGNNALGATIGKYCMNLAIEKCKSTGVGVVSAYRSNHYGIAGFYGLMAKEQGLIGISMTNTSPLQVATRAKPPATLGTNPISVVAPAAGDDCYALDMATSCVALGKIEVSKRKGEELPAGWGCDSEGLESRKPEPVLEGGGLFPLGGAEISGGYKGYGLAMMVEVLCGVLAGATWGPNIRQWQVPDETKEADLGQFFMALDPAVFGDGFEGRLQELMNLHRALDPIAGQDAVLVAGDPERQHETKCDEMGGIPYHPAFIRDMALLAEELEIEPMKTL